ncbi:tRNA dimethylallyltransferase [Betaproteobacteria bacterium]|nr:tRNA dimethylallyltransferase [Betaproteobacteria bacterium]GHU04302.1 tRNA dimethylallyltransferase [Betaproteobacteria bacterium]GHU16675.1 tRNA dimethylallyltransferase [Betaproteobacteria bacterium]
MLPPALLIPGPTASGKTACALALARELPVEIISVDSALVYREMDIGTAKPDATERAVCPHHLIDLISPEERYSAARFCSDARQLMAEISARGRIPLLVGGTMLYFKALREGLAELPHADATLRATIDQRARIEGWPALHAALARLDPAAAARLAPNDAQRIQRALEINLVGGKPLAEAQARHPAHPLPCRLITVALAPSERSVLHTRIAARFDQMLAAGLVDEVAGLRQRWRLNPDLPSMRAVGYRQAWAYLDGALDGAALRETGIAATRQLAKRQLTWQRQFREQWPDWAEIDCLRPDVVDAVRAVVQEQLARSLAHVTGANPSTGNHF